MLEKDLIEGEEAMIDFGAEVTEVFLQIGEIIGEQLVAEAMKEI